MVYIAKNKTGQVQQIMFVDGSCVSVQIGCSTKIDSDTIFPEEFVRIRRFFEVEKIVFRKTKKTMKNGGKR